MPPSASFHFKRASTNLPLSYRRPFRQSWIRGRRDRRRLSNITIAPAKAPGLCSTLGGSGWRGKKGANPDDRPSPGEERPRFFQEDELMKQRAVAVAVLTSKYCNRHPQESVSSTRETVSYVVSSGFLGGYHFSAGLQQRKTRTGHLGYDLSLLHRVT